LLLDKPLHMSSAGAVARAKRLYHARKAGHTGSLDPLATGMLPICFGEATKFGAQLLDADKTYRVSLRLGERTPSADRESQVVEMREVPPFSQEQILEALASFPRLYTQVPPMHSALKQEGKPLYEYARAGITRERAARTITIHEMTLVAWQRPTLMFDVRCTKGAYIRVLGEDLAARLYTIGHLAALRRLSVAPFGAEPMWQFEALESLAPPRLQELLLPVDAALRAWRRFDVSADGVRAIRQGKSIDLSAGRVEDAQGAAAPGPVRMYSDGLGFLGLGEIESAGRLVPRRLIAAGCKPRAEGSNANEA
jgi:tRNA pseudouridine55 synthase